MKRYNRNKGNGKVVLFTLLVVAVLAVGAYYMDLGSLIGNKTVSDSLDVEVVSSFYVGESILKTTETGAIGIVGELNSSTSFIGEGILSVQRTADAMNKDDTYYTTVSLAYSVDNSLLNVNDDDKPLFYVKTGDDLSTGANSSDSLTSKTLSFAEGVSSQEVSFYFDINETKWNELDANDIVKFNVKVGDMIYPIQTTLSA